MREPKNKLLGTMEPLPLMQLSVPFHGVLSLFNLDDRVLAVIDSAKISNSDFNCKK